MGAGRRPGRGRRRAGRGLAVTVPSRRLLADGTHSDVTFRAGGEELRLHRAVLLARAPLVCQALAGGRPQLDGTEAAELREFLR